MKDRVLVALLAFFAIVFYTVAVLNFIDGNVIAGVGNVSMAFSDLLIVFAIVRIERQRKLTALLANDISEFLYLLSECLPVGAQDKGDGGNESENDNKQKDE